MDESKLEAKAKAERERRWAEAEKLQRRIDRKVARAARAEQWAGVGPFVAWGLLCLVIIFLSFRYTDSFAAGGVVSLTAVVASTLAILDLP